MKITAEQIQYFAEIKEKKRNANKLAEIHKNTSEFKGNIKVDDLNQLRFHVQNINPASEQHLMFAYMHGPDQMRQFGFKANKLNDSDLRRILQLGRKNSTYISQNTFLDPKNRTSENAYSSKCFILDLDYYNIEKYKNLSAEQMLQVLNVNNMFYAFTPAYVISSGRGLSLVYLLENISLYNNQVMHRLRQTVCTNMIKAFKEYGADASGSDASRINRVPGSVNPKVTGVVANINISSCKTEEEILSTIKTYNAAWDYYNEIEVPFSEMEETIPKKPLFAMPIAKNKKVYILNFNNIVDNELNRYSISQLADYYVPQCPTKAIRANRTYSPNTSKLMTLNTLQTARMNDMFTLVKHRKTNNIEQNRKTTLYVLASAMSNCTFWNKDINDQDRTYNSEQIKYKLQQLNELFSQPVDYKIIESLAKYASAHDVKLKNSNIIDMVNISYSEQLILSTLICRTIKTQRQVEKIFKLRATNKASKITTLLLQLKEALKLRLKKSDIAKRLGISLSTLYRYIKRLGSLVNKEKLNILTSIKRVTSKQPKNDTVQTTNISNCKKVTIKLQNIVKLKDITHHLNIFRPLKLKLEPHILT